MTTTKAISFVTMILLVAVATGCNERHESALPITPARLDDFAVSMAVQARLYGADDVSGRTVDVTATHGTVTLMGTVESEAARQHAIGIARGVEGVDRVVDRLTVAPVGMPGGAAVATSGTRSETSPAWITTKIQAQYFLHPQLKPWNFDVTTLSDGRVSLRGQVDGSADKAEAVRIARTTDGVTAVEDELRVRGQGRDQGGAPAYEFTDPWLTAKVKSKYFVDPGVSDVGLEVSTQDGVVILRGTVHSEPERRRAIAIARSTDGVRDVRDELVVDPQRARTARQATQRVGSAVEDGWITTKIQAQYFLDRRIKGRQIDVDTRDGVVTLTGRVDSATAKEAAGGVAPLTDGVTGVVNRLNVGA